MEAGPERAFHCALNFSTAALVRSLTKPLGEAAYQSGRRLHRHMRQTDSLSCLQRVSEVCTVFIRPSRLEKQSQGRGFAGRGRPTGSWKRSSQLLGSSGH